MLRKPGCCTTLPCACTLQIGVTYASREAWVGFLSQANQVCVRVAGSCSAAGERAERQAPAQCAAPPKLQHTCLALLAQMGKLRHPHLSEVYGVVLPLDTDPRLAAPRSRSEPAVTPPGPLTAASSVAEGAGPLPSLPQLAVAAGSAGAAVLQRESTVPAIAEGMLPQVRPLTACSRVPSGVLAWCGDAERPSSCRSCLGPSAIRQQ